MLHVFSASAGSSEACETPRKRTFPTRPGRRGARGWARALIFIALAAVLSHVDVAAVSVGQSETGQTHAAAPTAAASAVSEEHPEHAEQGGGVVDILARLVNFGILAGTLFYLLRSPFRRYLADRGTQIRGDLVNAAETRQAAAAQIEEIDRRMKALPRELDDLRAHGAQEIAAEETRIEAAAAAERERLLGQARREIDQQVKVAERDLVAFAADLSVGVASERIKKNITDDDQKRLVDRYLQQLKPS
jgi:F-type H+-transporting ATPase subunit b